MLLGGVPLCDLYESPWFSIITRHLPYQMAIAAPSFPIGPAESTLSTSTSTQPFQQQKAFVILNSTPQQPSSLSQDVQHQTPANHKSSLFLTGSPAKPSAVLAHYSPSFIGQSGTGKDSDLHFRADLYVRGTSRT
jgi:hypothetical protein